MKNFYKNYILIALLKFPFIMMAQVGINTTTPQAQLDIKASNQATPSNTDGILIPRVDNFPVTNPTASQQGMLVYLTTTVGLNVPGFYYWDNASTSWKNVSQTIVETDPQVSSTTSNYIPKWNGTTLVDGNIYNGPSNIGIGTATPSEKLHLFGGNFLLDRGGITGGISRKITIEGARGSLGASFGQIDINNYDSDTATSYTGASIQSHNTQSTEDGDLRFFTNNGTLTERMNITNNGDVGIGTATPTEKLHISGGNIFADRGTSSNITRSLTLRGARPDKVSGSYAQLNFENFDSGGAGTTYTGARIHSFNSSVGLCGDLRFSTSTLTGLKFAMIIDELQKVGIGTLTPSTEFEVVGTSKTTNFQLTNGATAGHILQSDATGNATWVNPSTLLITETDPQVSSTTNNFIPKWNGTSLVDGQVIDDGTNIGIGTTLPTEKLHIQGNSRLQNGKMIVDNGSNSVYIGNGSGSNDNLSLILGNAAVGINSLNSNVSGHSNTAIGYFSLAANNVIGSANNSALGAWAARSNTTGIENVFIGAASGYSNITGSQNTFLGMSAGRSATGSNNVFLGYSAGYNETGSDKLYIDNSSTATPLVYGDFASNVLTVNGNLGVGTTTPTQAKLVVNGSANSSLASYGYLNSSGGTGSFTGPATNAYSIYASSRIAASEFNAFSDARIKKVISRSKSSEDLATLSKIQITNYKHIDTIANPNKEIKKVIAQELKEVYPNAVSLHRDFIPNVYKLSEIKNGIITVTNDFKVGDKVKLIFTEGEEIVEVKNATPNSFETNLKKSGKVFVYGKQVEDFHTVDYESLSTLNISATQELLKRIEKLEIENISLKAEVAKIDTLEFSLQKEKENNQKMQQDILEIKLMLSNKNYASKKE